MLRISERERERESYSFVGKNDEAEFPLLKDEMMHVHSGGTL